jgi:hypothetical protein
MEFAIMNFFLNFHNLHLLEPNNEHLNFTTYKSF